MDGQRVDAQADVARRHLDVLDARPRRVDAALPGHHAVALRVDAGAGHRRRLAQGRQGLLVVAVLAADQLEQLPGMGGARVAGKGGAQRHHAAHQVGPALGHFARVQAAQAPAHQAGLAVVAAVGRLQVGLALLQHARARTEVQALVPGQRDVAEAVEQIAHRQRGQVAGAQARKHQHRVRVTGRGAAQQRQCGAQRGQLPGRAALQQQQQRVGRGDLDVGCGLGAAALHQHGAIVISPRPPAR